MAVETVFHEENNQRKRRRDTNGEQYSLDIVRQTLPVVHRLVHHVERLDHDDHVQQRAEHEQNEDFLVYGYKQNTEFNGWRHWRWSVVSHNS